MSDTPEASLLTKADSRGKRLTMLGGALTATVFALLAWRQYHFVDRFAVNVMFWDQWGFYDPLFRNGSLWSIFDYQHGPHRQGIGFVLTYALAQCSGWNSRWDAFGVCFVLIGASVLGWSVAKKCGARGLGLVLVPLIFLNIRQYEMFVGAANISHGAMPMLLFMGISLAWFIDPLGWRLSTLCVLTFLIIFTGFGLFVGLLVPLVLAAQMVQYFRNRKVKQAGLVLLALIGIGGAWALFAHGYHFNPAVVGYRFPYEKPVEYLYFVASMLNNFHGVRGYGILAVGTGIATTVFLVVIALRHGWRFTCNGVQAERRSVVVFCLAAFALIYCFETAVGRVFLGWKAAASASRYVTLMIPAGLAIYLELSGLKNKLLSQSLCLIYAALLAFATIELHTSDLVNINYHSEGRRAWKAAYLETRDETKANDLSNFCVYPAPQLKERLQFLEKNRLNLFNPEGRP